MDAAVAGLVGAGVGAIVPTVGVAVSLVSARAERDERREARIFERRLDAYTGFATKLSTFYDEIGALNVGIEAQVLDADERKVEVEEILRLRSELVSLLGSVEIYGTSATAQSSRNALRAVSDWLSSVVNLSNGKHAQEISASDAFDAFQGAVRRDLSGD